VLSLAYDGLKETLRIAKWIKAKNGKVSLLELLQKFPQSHVTICRFFEYYPVKIIIAGEELKDKGCKGYYNGCNCQKCQKKRDFLEKRQYLTLLV